MFTEEELELIKRGANNTILNGEEFLGKLKTFRSTPKNLGRVKNEIALSKSIVEKVRKM